MIHTERSHRNSTLLSNIYQPLSQCLVDKRVGEWLFRVENSDGAQEARVQCMQWLSTQNSFIYVIFNVISHCPQTLNQALRDPA